MPSYVVKHPRQHLDIAQPTQGSVSPTGLRNRVQYLLYPYIMRTKLTFEAHLYNDLMNPI
jgi:hypothetical protein